MFNRKIITAVAMVLLLQSQAMAGTGQTWNVNPCKSLVQGTVVLNKVTQISVASFDQLGNSMVEVSGTSESQPMVIRFKMIKENCPDCTDFEKTRSDSSNVALDNARMAYALSKPFQVTENGPGAICNASPDKSNLKVFEVRSDTGGMLYPAGITSVGVTTGVVTTGDIIKVN